MDKWGWVWMCVCVEDVINERPLVEEKSEIQSGAMRMRKRIKLFYPSEYEVSLLLTSPIQDISSSFWGR